MVYKYFSELTPEDIRNYECRPDLHSGFGNETSHMQERGNVLGVSVPNINEWVVDIVKDGAPKPCQAEPTHQSQNSAIIKLYDKNVNQFKLNEQITFIGVLEFKMPQPSP